jgi:hypothetical protein
MFTHVVFTGVCEHQDFMKRLGITNEGHIQPGDSSQGTRMASRGKRHILTGTWAGEGMTTKVMGQLQLCESFLTSYNTRLAL